MPRTYYVYIMASISRRLYTGLTGYFANRVAQHKDGDIRGHTALYKNHKLVYYEQFSSHREALAREKQVKGWRREKRVRLIEEYNPTWRDLAYD